MNLSNSSTTVFACEMSKQVFTSSISGSTEKLESTDLEVIGKTSSRVHSAYKVTHSSVCIYIGSKEDIAEEQSCHWEIKYRKSIFKKCPFVTSSHHVPNSISVNSSRNFAHKEALHSDHSKIVDVSQFIILKITFKSVLQRPEYCIWWGLLLPNMSPDVRHSCAVWDAIAVFL